MSSVALACPNCCTPLKAFGHPGMTIHRAPDSEFLCDRCAYHGDDTCTFEKRPHALTCTIYQKLLVPETPIREEPRLFPSHWLTYPLGYTLLSFLLGLSLILTLIR
ncbi:MAG: zinc ribbon domain-containing protein [Cyanobacteria bacterium P01_H01_bin.15]